MPRAIAAGAYVRISDDRAGDAAGVGRQEADCRVLAERRGWAVDDVYTENDTSAFKRRKVRLPDGSTALRVDRPAFRKLLADLASGAVGALVAYDLDRIARDPRDLEDLIDVVETHKIPTAAVTGSLDLSTDSGVTMARIAVAIANKSSRDTSRRVARKHLELAEQGKVGGGGIRSYGYARDGMTVVESEAAVVREIAQRVIGGHSLSVIARDLTARAVPTVQGVPHWSSRSVHSVVSKGRNAGLREHKGEIVGPATWPPIIDRETWEHVKGALADRARGSNNTLVAWLTGTLLCAKCDKSLTGSRTARNRRRYWCATPKGGCGAIAVDAPGAERTVSGLIVTYLQRPDVLADLAATLSHESAQQARTDAAADEAQLAELAGMWGARKITTAEYLAARRQIEDRLKRSNAIMRAAAPSGVRALLTAPDITSAWAKLDEPWQRREVARIVFPHGITVHPAQRGTFTFDPDRLDPVDRKDTA
jgi:site-specific DNA recombinase